MILANHIVPYPMRYQKDTTVLIEDRAVGYLTYDDFLNEEVWDSYDRTIYVYYLGNFKWSAADINAYSSEEIFDHFPTVEERQAIAEAGDKEDGWTLPDSHPFNYGGTCNHGQVGYCAICCIDGNYGDEY